MIMWGIPVANGDDDSDGDWITPDNISKYIEKDQGLSIDTHEEEPISVACMTIDYSMQVCIYFKVKKKFFFYCYLTDLILNNYYIHT